MLRRGWRALPPAAPQPPHDDDDEREEVDAAAEEEMDVDPGPLLFLCWNILADGLAQDGGFEGVEDEVLEWEHRLPLVAMELASAQADVVCLQEASRCFARPADGGEAVWRGLDPVLAALGYDGMFAPKRPSPCERLGAPPDGVAILWKRNRCALASEPKVVYYPGENGTPMSQCYLVAHLADTVYDEGARLVTVVATHLKAKAENSATRVQQARYLCDALRDLHASPPPWLSPDHGIHALVVCGDLNDTPDSEAVRTLANHDSPPLAAAWDPAAYPWTTWKTREGTTKKQAIDHLFVVRGGPLVPLRTWSLPSADAVPPTGLPCASYPSDHVSVGAALAWRAYRVARGTPVLDALKS